LIIATLQQLEYNTIVYKENGRTVYDSQTQTTAEYCDLYHVISKNSDNPDTIYFTRKWVKPGTTVDRLQDYDGHQITLSDIINKCVLNVPPYKTTPVITLIKKAGLKDEKYLSSWDINTPYLFLGEFTKKNYSLNTD